jgi:uncharacterized protein YpuA (DUF1002 family)
LPRYTRERIKRGIRIRAIATKESKKYLEKYKLLEARYLPSQYISPASITIYGDKLGITLWSEEPITILVKNKEIAENFLKYFELIWKIAKE